MSIIDYQLINFPTSMVFFAKRVIIRDVNFLIFTTSTT